MPTLATDSADSLTRELGGLPVEVTSFVGRREAAAGVKHALARSRLVTLTGVGGVGKSRLALRVGRTLRRAFTDGVCWVDLAKLQNPGMVDRAVAAALGLRDQSARTYETVLAHYLADKTILVILDNCEHVLGPSANLCATLLSTAPGLRVLATSREPLGIEGEHIWPVAPLSLSEVAESARVFDKPTRSEHGSSALSGADRSVVSTYSEAVQLFEDRTRSVLPGFVVDRTSERVVSRLCQRLDGVPLAIELAAVRMRVLAPEQILARLEDRFRLLTGGSRAALPRHQTLRATVDWSFDLCSESARELWARCSVFVGGFDLAAAEAVCADDQRSAAEVLDGIAGLVDKSIVIRDQRGTLARYRMLDTIRHYGLERLAERGERAALLRRHRDYFLRLAEASDAESCGSGQLEWLQRLRWERANFWQALDYCCSTQGEGRTGLRMGAALWFYWVGCGFVRDGGYWLDRILALDASPTKERARALWRAGWIGYLQGDNEASLAHLEESLSLSRALGDETETTYAMQFLGEAETFDNNVVRGEVLLDEALDRQRSSDRWTAPGLLVFAQRAWVAAHVDIEYAVALLSEGRAICAASDERWTRSWIDWHLGAILWIGGRHQESGVHLRKSLRTKREFEDPLGFPFVIELLALVSSSEGDAERAGVLFGAAEKMWQLIGRPLAGIKVLLAGSETCRTRSRNALGDQAFEAAIQKGRSMSQKDAIAYALGEKATPTATEPTGAPPPQAGLTKREQEVADLIARGQSNKEIANTLVISQRTAETHVENILMKLGLRSRTQVVTWLTRRHR
ncbi:LuxR C-terminal-related transcriptional regulator [Actinopolymorpha sp. B17G11]|uniref:LuxR C-terminal-related transcriptional regulator n=1 Tax=Actinopolymorpha sp. B17G11 TaxID=3160861 RepID=UPI0032E51975